MKFWISFDKIKKISNKVFTKILLWLRENFEKILDFRVYFAEIILRIFKENFEKVVCNRKNFRVISRKFWLNLENNEEIFVEIWRFFTEIGRILGKFIRCPNITRNFEENFGKMRSIFWRNFVDSKINKIFNKFK